MTIWQPYIDILLELQYAGVSEAYVYGGALRDHHHSKEINDIDIILLGTQANHDAVDSFISMRKRVRLKELNLTEEGAAEDSPKELLKRIENSVTIENIEDHYGIFKDIEESKKMWTPWVKDSKINSKPINFVFLLADQHLSQMAAALRCDFGICQVSLDIEGDLYMSHQFVKDSNEKTFTYMRDGRLDDEEDINLLEASKRRFERLTMLSGKYKDWKLVLPAWTGH